MGRKKKKRANTADLRGRRNHGMSNVRRLRNFQKLEKKELELQREIQGGEKRDVPQRNPYRNKREVTRETKV